VLPDEVPHDHEHRVARPVVRVPSESLFNTAATVARQGLLELVVPHDGAHGDNAAQIARPQLMTSEVALVRAHKRNQRGSRRTGTSLRYRCGLRGTPQSPQYSAGEIPHCTGGKAAMYRYIEALHRYIGASHQYIEALHRYIGALHQYIGPLNRYIAALYRYIGALHRCNETLYRCRSLFPLSREPQYSARYRSCSHGWTCEM